VNNEVNRKDADKIAVIDSPTKEYLIAALMRTKGYKDF